MKLRQVRNALGLLLKAAEIGALLAVILLAAKLKYAVEDADTTIREARATIIEVHQRVDDTSQNVNAVLLQLGLAADEARRTSGEQRRYLGQMSREGIAILADARHTIGTLNQTIARIGADADQVSASSVTALDNIPPLLQQGTRTLDSAQTLLADPNLPSAIQNLSLASQNTAAATASLAAAAGDIQKKVHDLTKPVSFVKSLLSSLLGWAAQVATLLK